MKVAVVGATGLVGQVMLRVLEQRNFPVTELIPVASEKSVGKTLKFKNEALKVSSLEDAVRQKPSLALFSAGSAVSGEWAPRFAEEGTTVIDNSSCWRMHNEIPLVVPEVNASVLSSSSKIIANPNCSTIQLVVAVNPLHQHFRVKRIVVSTYQSVTGTGVKAVNQLFAERQGIATDMAYPHPIDLNCIPHGGSFLDGGYTTEEQKLIDETRKIIGDPHIMVSPTVVRVPVVGGHSESVNIEFEKDFLLEQVYDILKNSPGVTVQDVPSENTYPMPRMAQGRDDVFVGRIRRDVSKPRCLNLWLVSDNLRKGAATNAVQIAEYLLLQNWLK